MFSVRRFLHGFLSVLVWFVTATFCHSVHQFLLFLGSEFLLLLSFVFIPLTRPMMILISDLYYKTFRLFTFVHVLKYYTVNETIEYVFDIFSPLNIYAVPLTVVISICSNLITARVQKKDNRRLNGFPPKVFDDGVCAVCMLPHVDPSRPITCGYTFCYECLIRWCCIKITCPICSQVFTRLQRTSGDGKTQHILTVNQDFILDRIPVFDFDFARPDLMVELSSMFMSLSSLFGVIRMYREWAV
jgi:hypothetical protein